MRMMDSSFEGKKPSRAGNIPFLKVCTGDKVNAAKEKNHEPVVD